MAIPANIRAWLYLVPLIPSVLIAIFDLYHLLINRVLRTSLNNHVIILLLFTGLVETLTDIPFTIYFLFNGTVPLSKPAFCTAWTFISSTSLIASFILMAWASMERHIIIFHTNLHATKAKRMVFHYIPLAICILWPTMFYTLIYYIIPCNSPYSYNARQCGRSACIASSTTWAALCDNIADYVIPAFVTVIFSIALFVRVLYKRFRARGRIDWGNYKKMAAQLLPISALYMCLQLPPMTLNAAYSAGLSRTVASNYYGSGVFFMYWVILFTPFVSVLSLPDLKIKCRNLFLFWRRRRAVQPEMMEMTRRNAGQTVAMVPVVKPVKIEMTRRNVGQIVAVVPIIQPVMIETDHQNVDQTVEALSVVQPVVIETDPQNADQKVEPLPVIQPVMIETDHQNVDQTVEALSVVQPVVIETAPQNVDQTVEPLPVIQPVIIETAPQNVGQTVEPLPPVVI